MLEQSVMSLISYLCLSTDILRRNKSTLQSGGVVSPLVVLVDNCTIYQVHSFDGSWDDAQAALDCGLYIGLNGWLVPISPALPHIIKLLFGIIIAR